MAETKLALSVTEYHEQIKAYCKYKRWQEWSGHNPSTTMITF